jgi:ligand-binding sensor domain-containing protein
MKRLLVLLLLGIVFCTTLFAQELPIGQWQSMYPYTTCNGVAIGGGKIYSGRYGLLEYDMATKEYNQYSKVNGLTDVGILKMAYAVTKNALIITYESSNIDILQNGIFYNIPDVKKANIIASKRFNNIGCINGDAYISSGLGIIVVNIDKKEIKATYPMLVNGLQSEVYDVALRNNQLFAATSNGLFVANAADNFLQNINNWTLINTSVFKNIHVSTDSMYICTDTSMYSLDVNNITHKLFSSSATILDIDTKNNSVVLSTNQRIIDLQKDGTLLQNYFGNSATQIATNQNDTWAANPYGGLTRIQSPTDIQRYAINGPFSADAFNMRWINNSLYVCSGGVEPSYNWLNNRSGLNKYSNQYWLHYNQYSNYTQMDSAQDILDVVEDPVTKSIYMASFGGGLIEIKQNGDYVQLARNSVIGSSENGNYAWLATNLKYDANNNLWITVSNADKNLVVKKADGSFKSFSININGDFKPIAEIAIDNIGQKWMVVPRQKGVVVFNDNGTIDNDADDQQKYYSVNAGNGNLASNNVRCITKDADGKIWIGTDDGISIVNCPENAFGAGGCDAENKIVQYDAFANTLFNEEYISTIAVDGANRKWVGTFNGIWLISADAEKIIQRFTVDNSPLPSNEINKIEIDPITGVVYIATSQGLVSYKSTATDGAVEPNKLFVYPNPVEATHDGPIAIKGFVTNADVRIVDEAGQLVYRTIALGGQAVWNGKTYTGARPQSGVYYVLGTNADGSQTQQAKIIFMH